MSKLSMIAVAAMCTACGGGGGGEPAPAAQGVVAPVAAPSNVPAPVTLPASEPASGGTGVVAAVDTPPASELEPELRQPRPPWPTGPDAERSMRSLNWWSEDPRLVNFMNATCSPQPDCVIPDGDLNLHNRACDDGTATNCEPRLKLYDDPIFPEDRVDPRPPLAADPTPPGTPTCTTTFRCPPGSIDPATQGA